MTREDGTALVDLHNHLIPAVDDGATSLDEALTALAAFTRAGVRKVVCTPHIDASLAHQGTRLDERVAEVGASWSRFADAARRDFPEVDLRKGWEIAIDLPDPDLSDRRLGMDGGRFLLMEWPGLRVPPGTTDVLRRIRDQGVHPVIAHPERYRGLEDPSETARRWRDAGAYLQVNHGSLVGRYGPQARATAFDLLRRGWVDYLASDYHGRTGIPTYIPESREALAAAVAEEIWDVLTRVNPDRLLNGEVPLRTPPLPEEEGWMDVIRRALAGRSRPPPGGHP